MIDTQYSSTPAMSVEIQLDTPGNRNPMDLASLLNPLPTPPPSESEGDWDAAEQKVYESVGKTYQD